MNQLDTSKIYFLTFGGPTENYHYAVKRICSEATNFKIFDYIIGKTDNDLKNDEIFWSKHKDFIENNKRGYGYWLWKSYLVKKQLEQLNDNDILLYADSGCHLNINGLPRLFEYFNIVKNSKFGILSFQMDITESLYTKMDVGHCLNALDEMKTGQLHATTFIIKKCEHSVNLVNKWYNFCCIYNLINDTPSKKQNDPNFRDHRHDQSLWSIIRKKYGSEIISDETYFLNFVKDGQKYPIWAVRYRQG
jgi:hypothetical protein